jgi:hypothetical protein
LGIDQDHLLHLRLLLDSWVHRRIQYLNFRLRYPALPTTLLRLRHDFLSCRHCYRQLFHYRHSSHHHHHLWQLVSQILNFHLRHQFHHQL